MPVPPPQAPLNASLGARRATPARNDTNACIAKEVEWKAQMATAFAQFKARGSGGGTARIMSNY